MNLEFLEIPRNGIADFEVLFSSWADGFQMAAMTVNDFVVLEKLNLDLNSGNGQRAVIHHLSFEDEFEALASDVEDSFQNGARGSHSLKLFKF